MTVSHRPSLSILQMPQPGISGMQTTGTAAGNDDDVVEVTPANRGPIVIDPEVVELD